MQKRKEEIIKNLDEIRKRLVFNIAGYNEEYKNNHINTSFLPFISFNWMGAADINDYEEVYKDQKRSLNDERERKLPYTSKNIVLDIFHHLIDTNQCIMVTPNYKFIQGDTSGEFNLVFEMIKDIGEHLKLDKKYSLEEYLKQLFKEVSYSVKFTFMEEEDMIKYRLEKCHKKFGTVAFITPLYCKFCLEQDEININFLTLSNMWGLHVFETLKWSSVWGRREVMEQLYWIVYSSSFCNMEFTQDQKKNVRLETYDTMNVTWKVIKPYVEDMYAKKGIYINSTGKMTQNEIKKYRNQQHRVDLKDQVFGYEDMIAWIELLHKKREIDDLEVDKERLEEMEKKIGRNTEPDNYQFWIGKAPFCSTSEGECESMGPFTTVQDADITDKDRASYGSSCWSGTKRLCRLDLDKLKSGDYFEFAKLDFIGDPRKYKFKWYGTGPLCNPEPTDPLKDGYIPIASHVSGDGSSCLSGQKLLAVQPKDKNDRFFKLLISLEEDIKKLEIDDKLTKNAFKKAVFGLIEKGISKL